MTEPRIPSSPVGEDTAVQAGQCPGVAELLDFVLGHVSHADRQRIDGHLNGPGCPHCQRWIDSATRYHGELAARPGALAIPVPAPPPPNPDPTPIPESPKWQRRAFQDLERRLRLLEA